MPDFTPLVANNKTISHYSRLDNKVVIPDLGYLGHLGYISRTDFVYSWVCVEIQFAFAFELPSSQPRI